MRDRIVDEARRIAQTGAHYLTYAFGARPGERDPIKGRTVRMVNTTDWANLAVHTAEINNPACGGVLRCTGKYLTRARRHTHPTTMPIPANYNRWLATAGGGGSNPVRPMNGNQYPRRRVINRNGCPPNQGADICDPKYIYLGDSCVGKMHFDCVGFICYVFTHVLGRTIDYGLTAWPNQGTPVPRLAAAQPCDLVFWPGHIAIVTGLQGGRPVIAHAAGDRWGVKEEPLSRADVQVKRLGDNFFRS